MRGKTIRILVLAQVAGIVCGLFAADVGETKPRKKIDRARAEESFRRRTGGRIVVPGSRRGEIVVVNAQNRANGSLIGEIVERFARDLCVGISVTNGGFSFPPARIPGNAALYVVDDADLPSVLHAPEQRWTMVNVAALSSGAGERAAFFEARVKKELVRGFSLLAGAQTSNYPNSLLGCVTKPSDLDRFADWELPVDIPARFPPYLAGFGIRPEESVTYLEACREGWAPVPTNEWQRAVWERERAIPSEPMKIEFDPRRGR